MYEYKYVNKSTRKTNTKAGRPCSDTYITGTCPIRRDKYYSWMKHKAQAKYRNEEHDLSWPEFESLWTDELWAERGRLSQEYSMYRLDPDLPWTIDNVEVGIRHNYLKRSAEYRSRGG